MLAHVCSVRKLKNYRHLKATVTRYDTLYHDGMRCRCALARGLSLNERVSSLSMIYFLDYATIFDDPESLVFHFAFHEPKKTVDE